MEPGLGVGGGSVCVRGADVQHALHDRRPETPSRYDQQDAGHEENCAS